MRPLRADKCTMYQRTSAFWLSVDNFTQCWVALRQITDIPALAGSEHWLPARAFNELWLKVAEIEKEDLVFLLDSRENEFVIT